MNPLTLSDSETMILAIQEEIRGTQEARYHHRLHGILLVAQGMTCPQVAHLLGDAPRTVEYWVRHFEKEGFASLLEGERPGRPSRLSAEQLGDIEKALRGTPAEAGHGVGAIWDGKTLSVYIKRRFGITLEPRQCQRLFRRLGFRLRKPRPVIALADSAQHAAVKKTPNPGRKSRG